METKEELTTEAITHRLKDILFRTPALHSFTISSGSPDTLLDTVEELLTKDLKRELAEKRRLEEELAQLKRERNIVRRYFGVED